MFKCFAKRSSVINSICSGQVQFSYKNFPNALNYFMSLLMVQTIVLSVFVPFYAQCYKVIDEFSK
jgi:hypothetical protein